MLVLAAASGAAAGFCGQAPYGEFVQPGWTELVQWNSPGSSTTPYCWQSAIAGSGNDVVSSLPTALLCTTGSWGGNSTVLMWLDGMSMPHLPGTPLPCPYDGYYAIAAYASQRMQLYFQGSLGVNTSASRFSSTDRNGVKKTPASDKHAQLARAADAAAVAAFDSTYCGFQPANFPLSSTVGGFTPLVWWSGRGTQFVLSCFRTTVVGTTPWPVEAWIGCTSELYQGTGNVTLIERLSSNHLPSTSQTFQCPFAGYFAVFVKSLGQPANVAALSVNIDGTGYTDNATAPEFAMPPPRAP